MTIARITDAYVRHYSDSLDTKVYVEWVDNLGKTGRTEDELWPCEHTPLGAHMTALFTRANREGIAIRGETW